MVLFLLVSFFFVLVLVVVVVVVLITSLGFDARVVIIQLDRVLDR